MKSNVGLHRLLPLVAVGFLFGLAGCPGGSSSSAGLGSVSLSVADTPVDGLRHVVIALTEVRLHSAAGPVSILFDNEKTVDLLAYQGTDSAKLVHGQPIPSGDYQWIELDLDLAHSYVITKDGNQYPLVLPSGDQSGLKLMSGFNVADAGRYDFLIDFNLRKSLTKTSNPNSGTEYILNPSLRLVNLQAVGSVGGTAANTLAIGTQSISDPSCSPAVYVFSGAGTTPEGFDVSLPGGTPPLTSATLTLDNNTGNYDYTAGFLEPGEYTLAVTCAANDKPGSTSLAFTASKVIDVSVNREATVDFP